MKNSLAKILSALLHPLLMPTIGILILFNSGTIYEFLSFPAQKVIFIIVILSTIILPLTFVPFYVFQKIIKNVQMDDRRERLIPFFVTFILYVFCYYLLIRLNAPELKTIVNFILIGAISTLLIFGLSFRWKISAHMTGIGAMLGSLIAFSFILKVNLELYIVITILLSGILAYSRLTLNKHKPYQIYSGWAIGIVVSLLILFFF
jgi:hypothetical protein